MNNTSRPEFTLGKGSDYPSSFPPKEFHQKQSDITLEQLTKLRELVYSRSAEKVIDLFIRDNPTVLTAALKFASTGHHGCWVLSQQMIRPRLRENQPGLIPDYIIGGKSSYGFDWWVIDLKGADTQLFSRKNNYLYLSEPLNRGICQLLAYIDYCDDAQATLRDQLKLTNFRRPNGMIIIGREDELENDEQKQKLKSAWNKLNAPHLEIRTYDALLRATDELYRDFDSLRSQFLERGTG